MKTNLTSASGVLLRGLAARVVSIIALCVLVPSVAAQTDQTNAAPIVRFDAGDVVGEQFAEAVVESVHPLEDHVSMGGDRGTGPGALHSNLQTYLNSNFINGGASGSGAAAITKLIAGHLFLASTGSANRIKFAIVNTLGTQCTFRPRVRFYQANGTGGGPGTLFGAITFVPVSVPGNTLVVFFADIPAITFSNECWAGMTFDAGGTGSPTATIAQLNGLGMGLFSPATVGDINGQMFRTSSAGSFESNNPAGSTSSNAGTAGWEIRNTAGACCFSYQSCQTLTEVECLTAGGNFRGGGSSCATACLVAANFLNATPPAGYYYALDQVSLTDPAAPGLQTRQSQQYAAIPPSNLNIAYIDEFTLTQKRVVSRIDSLVKSGGAGETLPLAGGFLMSVWPSPAAAAADATLQGNTLYNQGYTVPAFRGGGEYDLVSFVGGSNPLGLQGLALKINPDIAFRPDSSSPRDPGDRGITPPDTHGLVLPAGTYYISVMHRGPVGMGPGLVADSTHQDPRFPTNNGFQVNPLGGQFPGGSRNTNNPAAYRVLVRNCRGDFNGDGNVNTGDLVGFLGSFGQMATSYSPYDLNGDAAINTLDLTEFLASFATNVPPGTSGDLNGDGVVNTQDLTLFLGAFGTPCP